MKRLFSILNTIIILMMLGWANASAVDMEVGDGADSSPYPYGGNYGGRLSKFVFTAEELKNAGILPGKIKGISFKVANEAPTQNENLQNFMIRVRHYSDTILTSDYVVLDRLDIEPDWVICKGETINPIEYNPKEGDSPWKKITFDAPFVWNGNNSIIIEIGWNNYKRRLTSGRMDPVINVLSGPLVTEYRGGVNHSKTIVVGVRDGEFNEASPEVASFRPVVRLDVEHYKSILKTTDSVNFDYVELNTESLVKSFLINMVGADPLDGSVVLKPAENAYVSLDGETFVTAPEELSVDYTGGRLKDKQIYCKIKGSETPVTEGLHTAIVTVSAGEKTNKVVLHAHSTGNIFGEYCRSFGRDGADILKLTIEKNGNEILSNGKVPEKSVNLPLEAVNKFGYSNFVTTAVPPLLRAGDEYKFSVDLGTSDPVISEGRLYVYMDKDRNGVLTNKEIVIFESFAEGTKRIEKTFIMPTDLTVAGDGRVLMRVILIQSSDPIDPCSQYQGGETEDYAVTLAPMAEMSVFRTTGVSTGNDSYRPGTEKAVIGNFRVVLDGVTNPYELTEYVFKPTGTSDVSDIENIELWYTGKNEEFIEETAILYDRLDNIVTGDNIMTLENGDKAKMVKFPSGVNNFFITCDIKKSATKGKFLDMESVSLKLKNSKEELAKQFVNPNPNDKHLIRGRLEGAILVGGAGTGDPQHYYSDIFRFHRDLEELGASDDIELVINSDIVFPKDKNIEFSPINDGLEPDEGEDELRKDIRLTIYPNKKATISGNFTKEDDDAQAPLIIFNGMKNVTIDGRINKTGNKNGLTIENKGKNGAVSSVMFYDTIEKQVEGIEVKYVNFVGNSRKNKDSHGLHFYNIGAKNAVIANNEFKGYRNGLSVEAVVIDGASPIYVSNLTIENNIFSDSDTSKALSGSGINLNGSNNVTIKGNSFSNIVNDEEGGSCQAILLQGSNIGTKIINNHIDSIFANNNGQANGIVSATDANSELFILGNVIHRVASNGLEGSINSGFALLKGKDIKVYHNLVLLEGNRSNIPGIKKGTPSLKSHSYSIYVAEDVERLSLRNNIFINNLRHEEKFSGKAYCIAAENSESFMNADYNVYYAEGTNQMLGFLENDKSKVDFWAEAIGKDKNSLSKKVDFIRDGKNKFGTLAGNSAIDNSLYVPAIDGLEVTEDIHGNRRGTKKVTIGVDDVIPVFAITKQMPELVDKKCSPYVQSLVIGASVTEFNDKIERKFTNKPNFSYQWRKNDVDIPNIKDGKVTDKSNIYNVIIEESNINNPDYFTVQVSFFDNKIVSDRCTIKVEGTLAIKKQPESVVILCKDSGVNRLEVQVKGDVSAYQWQKKVGEDEWKDLEGDNKQYLDVSLLNSKYGEGKYRVKIFDGDYDCNKGFIYSKESEVIGLEPVDNARLYSDDRDVTKTIEVCEGSSIEVKLDRDPITGLKGDIVGYRWEEKVDGIWEEVDIDEKPFLTNDGFNINYADTTHSGTFRLVVIGNAICGKKEAVSNEVSIEVNPFVLITNQPKADVVCKGSNIGIKVKTSAINKVEYQWLKNGIIITPEENETANSDSLVIKNAQYDDAAVYSVIVTVDACLKDGGNKLYSENASIVVMNETQITRQPEDQDAMLGKKAMFVVESNAIGEEPDYVAEYQWYRQYVREGAVHNEALEEGGKYNGVKSNILIIQNVEEKDAGYLYYVNIKGLCGDTVNSRYVMLKTTDFGFTHLENKKKACDGEEVTLSALAESSKKDDAIVYEWHFVTGDNDEIDEIIPGDSAKIKVTANKYTQGKYYVIAKLVKLGNIIKSNFITLEVGTKPQITKPIAETNANVGELFTLTSEAVGANFKYQWYRDTTLIPNAVSANLTTSEAKAGTYTYMVVVTNECGSDTSVAKVSVAGNISHVDEVEEYGFSVSNIIPNPVVSNEAKFTVSSEVMSKAEITIVDAAGRNNQFFSGNIAGSKEFSINTSRYPNGAYYVVIVIDGKKMTRRFIVEK